jgi:hypothetical protein
MKPILFFGLAAISISRGAAAQVQQIADNRASALCDQQAVQSFEADRLDKNSERRNCRQDLLRGRGTSQPRFA